MLSYWERKMTTVWITNEHKLNQQNPQSFLTGGKRFIYNLKLVFCLCDGTWATWAPWCDLPNSEPPCFSEYQRPSPSAVHSLLGCFSNFFFFLDHYLSYWIWSSHKKSWCCLVVLFWQRGNCAILWGSLQGRRVVPSLSTRWVRPWADCVFVHLLS